MLIIIIITIITNFLCLSVGTVIQWIFYVWSERWCCSWTTLNCTDTVYIWLIHSGLHLLHAPFGQKEKKTTFYGLLLTLYYDSGFRSALFQEKLGGIQSQNVKNLLVQVQELSLRPGGSIAFRLSDQRALWFLSSQPFTYCMGTMATVTSHPLVALPLKGSIYIIIRCSYASGCTKCPKTSSGFLFFQAKFLPPLFAKAGR